MHKRAMASIYANVRASMFVKVARSKHGVLNLFLSCASDHTIFRDICVQGGLLMNMRGDLMNASRAFGDVLINFRGNFS